MTKRAQFAIGVRRSRARRAPRANPYDQSAYDRTINELKEVVSGRRGWVSLTRAAKASGVPKGQLKVAAESLGLEVVESHGNAGMVASRRARSKANPWPFSSKKEKPARLKSSLTIAQAVREAKAAGYRGTDFNEWLERKRLADRSSSQLSTLGDAYRSGMDAKEAEREKKEQERAEARQAREEKKASPKRGGFSVPESFKPDDEKLDRHFRKGGTLAQFLSGEIRNPAKEPWEKKHPDYKRCPKCKGTGTSITKSRRHYATCSQCGGIGWKYAPKSKSNPGTSADAQAAYEEFHGKPSNESVRITRRVHFHKNLASAGQLRSLILKSVGGKKIRIRFTKDTLLTFNTAKNQLFITGGDQSIDNLKPYGIRSPHEIETLGKVLSLDYFTTKDHLGSEGGTAVYRHKLRTTNQNGQHVTVRVARYPDLIYYTRDRRMEFSGGSYEIIAEGIDK